MKTDRQAYRDFEDNWLYALGHRICRSLFRKYFRFEVYGGEHTPETGALLMCNHASYLDPVLVGAGLDREVCYMARSNLFVGPFGTLIRTLNAFPIHRGKPDRAALKRALELAHSGRLVLVFPEGTRTQDGRLGEAALGASFLAYHARTPVLPLYLQNSYHVLPRGRAWPARAKVRLYVGAPIPLDDLRTRSGREVYATIGRRIMDAIGILERNADPSRRDRPAHLVANWSRAVHPTGRKRSGLR